MPDSRFFTRFFLLHAKTPTVRSNHGDLMTVWAGCYACARQTGSQGQPCCVIFPPVYGVGGHGHVMAVLLNDERPAR